MTWGKPYRALSAALLHARVAAVLLALPVLLKLRPVHEVVWLLTPRDSPHARAGWQEVTRVQWAVDRLYQKPLLRSYGPCLRRALTLYFFVTRLGYPARVTFGARLIEGKLIAHGWLTLDGEPLLEPGRVSGYRVVAEWGGSRSTDDGIAGLQRRQLGV